MRLIAAATIGRTRLIDNLAVEWTHLRQGDRRVNHLFVLTGELSSTGKGTNVMAISQKGAEFLLRSRLADAARGDVDALFELGVTYSTGRGGIAVDLVEAHKWFNLAACRAAPAPSNAAPRSPSR